mmetsp:Transcript_8093/g.15843  ORF Transcript_8093/g.15843 Transcript_8093/m.15843 type:complete len:220 (+) Transcript_8093:544-1203(+)
MFLRTNGPISPRRRSRARPSHSLILVMILLWPSCFASIVISFFTSLLLSSSSTNFSTRSRRHLSLRFILLTSILHLRRTTDSTGSTLPSGSSSSPVSFGMCEKLALVFTRRPLLPPRFAYLVLTGFCVALKGFKGVDMFRSLLECSEDANLRSLRRLSLNLDMLSISFKIESFLDWSETGGNADLDLFPRRISSIMCFRRHAGISRLMGGSILESFRLR